MVSRSSGDGGIGIDQVGRVKLFGAIVALVAARAFKAAIGAGALDIAIRQKAAVGIGIHLFFSNFADQAQLCQAPGEMLGQTVVARRGRAPEMIKAHAESVRDPCLCLVQFGAVFRHRHTGLCGGKFCGGAMFVGGAKEQHLMAARAQVAGIQIGGQLAANQIAQMLDPVDIRKGRSDQVARHVRFPWLCVRIV